MNWIYDKIGKELFGWYSGMLQGRNEDLERKCLEQNYTEEEQTSFIPKLLTPLVIHIDERVLLERSDLYKMMIQNKDYFVIKFYIHQYYSNYLLCYLMLDIIDLLSNDCSQIQTKFEFIFENQQNKNEFVKELKVFLKSNVFYLNKKKIIPIYSKFLEPFSMDIEYCLVSNHQFNVLYLKENEDSFFIQRIYFSIDL